MKNSIPRKGLKIYSLLIFIGILILSSFTNPCSAQNKPGGATYKTVIQQADKALDAKDYATALLLYEKAISLKPEYNYASDKIEEINKTLDGIPDSKATLFENLILQAESFFKQKDYQQAKAEYQKALMIDPTAQFPKDRLNQIAALYTDPDDQATFMDAVANGDKALSANEFDKAIQNYETALALKPGTKAVKDKISLAKKQQLEFKAKADQLAQIIAGADKQLQSGKRPEAKVEYQKALAIAPDNQYVVLKIKDIDNYEVNKQALQEAYDKAIEQADQFYINRDFANARVKYQEALVSKPEARYPKDMLEKTKSGEAQLQSDQQKYDAALASAENFFNAADYDAAVIGYKSASAIKPTEEYPKTKIAQIEKLVADKSSRKEAFDIAIKNGDQSFNEKKFEPALAHYRNALSLMPGEKYPAEKITEINTLLGLQKGKDENYNKLITDADKQFRQNKFEDAIATYSKALELKPEETYPGQKIKEAQDKLSAARNKEENYAAAVSAGDRLIAETKYEEAIQAYENALALKPAQEYPISKIAEINFLVTKQKSDSAKYTKAIEKGDKALESGNLLLAIKSFQDALSIKPSAEYPLSKVTEIKAEVENQQKTDANYATAIKTADQLFAGKMYNKALTSYTEAAELKKNEKYPADQIAKINKLVSDMHSADENYSRAIAEADNNFNNQKYADAATFYNKALLVKPAETYPKTQLDKINTLLEEQKQLDAAYLAAITSADKILVSKKYDEAIAEYRKALELKPSEKYPSEKIAETEKLIADIKSQQESYDKAIAAGDKLLLDKEYMNAIATYKSASLIKPAETYPMQKISEIQAILDKDKAESERYQEAIAQADKSFNDKKYNEALEPYQRAETIKPSEKYPREQIAKINQLLAEQKKLDEDYQKLITDAGAFLKEGKYNESKGVYNNALKLKPSEQLPKDKIAEIEGILADLKNKEENYSKYISTGDAGFTGKKYTEAITAYDAALKIKPTETYPKSQVEKINAILAEQKRLDDDYLAVIATANQFFESKKYSEAIADYRKASALKPSEKYPSEKIAESSKLMADIKAQQEAYDKAIAEGDKKLAAKDYENAMLAYKSASSAKPTETYPVQKIAEIQTILDNIAAENTRYQETVASADKLYTDKKYTEALDPYQRASAMKPAEKYPTEQISKINQLLAEQKTQNEDYQKLLTDADAQLKAGKYTEARIGYTNAGLLKPSEKLPKDKIAEIDGILADLKLKDENYTKAINTAAEMHAAKNLTGTIQSYEKALTIKPTEKYPQERIAAIKAEIKAIDDNYAKAIALGDSKLAGKNLMDAMNAYQNALEIKPGEEYPKTKIAGINATLAAQKEDQEKMYTSYLAEGDRLLAAKDFSGAKSAFTKASGIKTSEAYPKQRLAEINKTVEEIELARRAEYNKAIGEADKLYTTQIFDLAIDAYEAASKINPGDPYPDQQISKIRKYMVDHAIQDLYSQTLAIGEGNEKKFTFSAIDPRLRKNNYILLKARSTGKNAPKVYLNYGKDNQKNGGIVLRSLDKTTINDYLIRISVQDKWFREDNNWISLFVETGDIEITKVQIAAGE